jgi:hypothetical protein
LSVAPRIVLDNSRYYLLGYYSDSRQWSRKFLKLDVRVKRPGLEVRARRGFLPPDPKAAAKAREAEVKAGTSPALKAALSKPVPIGDLPFRVFAAPFKGAGSSGSVFIALEIDGASPSSRNVTVGSTSDRGLDRGGGRASLSPGGPAGIQLNLQPQTHERVAAPEFARLAATWSPGRYQIHGCTRALALRSAPPYDVEARLFEDTLS